LANETVWLTLSQLAILFDRDKSVISRHLRNIYAEGELTREATVAKNATVQDESGRMVMRQIEYYNLDVIISIGYRVKSFRGTQFRQWANKVLKEYLLRGYSINQHLMYVERIDHQLQEHTEQIHELQDKVDFFVRTSLPPKEGVFYNGQIFDAYISRSIPKTLQLDIDKLKKQYPPIEIQINDNYHDRFLIVDKDVYHIGASLKDLGKRIFAFTKMETPVEVICGRLTT